MSKLVDVKLISVFDEYLHYVKGKYMLCINKSIAQIFQDIENSNLVKRNDAYIINNLILKNKPIFTSDMEEYINYQFICIRKKQIKWLKKQPYFRKRNYLNHIQIYQYNIKKQVKNSLAQRTTTICSKLNDMFNGLYSEIKSKMLSGDRIISDKYNLEVFDIILSNL